MLELLTVRDGWLHAGAQRYACHIGRTGLAAKGEKREGDLKTPTGKFPLRFCYWRPDRFDAPPPTALPLLPLAPDDGWCDDATHALYNQPVKLPFDGRHEKLWRSDHVYDLIIPLGYNDAPAVPGLGSAIFLHLARHDGIGTEGCVALKRDDLLALLPQLGTGTQVDIGI
jgi:L,D-peptidoglycan transpeptidase YkuD (ErfK/YbiS/YcfS/YnhG family)